MSWRLLALLSGAWALVVLCSTLPARAEEKEEEGFQSLFNGENLEGWEGREGFWSVRDGAITGETTKDKPTSGNTFLIWKGGTLGDFELRLQFRIVGFNSGIQYRSQDLGDYVVRGYQADFDAGGDWTGTLYEEGGRAVLAKRGSQVVIKADGAKETVGVTTPEAEIVESIKKEDWNDYTIIARGNHLIHMVNGHVTIDVVDEQSEKAKAEGILALQLHAGPPMTVQFRDVRLKVLE